MESCEFCDSCVKLRKNCLRYSFISVRTTMFRVSSLGILFIFLVALQTSNAYVTVSMRDICKQKSHKSIHLTPTGLTSATSLTLEAPKSQPAHPCRLDISAPENSHSLSLLFTRRKKQSDKYYHDSKRNSCNLTISFPLLEEVRMSVDLCSTDAEDSIRYTDLLPQHVTLEWSPPLDRSTNILASEIVITAVGRGREICNEAGMFPCISQRRYPVFCIANELACDGRRNCPLAGDDEDKELCQTGILTDHARTPLARARSDELQTTSNARTWEIIASEIIKSMRNAQPEIANKTETVTTEKPEDSSEVTEDNSEGDSIPDVLSHYGPWGYLMLGMLICGSVLMICGLWECCCRQPKSTSSNSSGPTLLIINQGADLNDLETPATPGPPRYEDLDQPPSYTALFPTSKLQEFSNADTLPISDTRQRPDPLPMTRPLTEALRTTNYTSRPESSEQQPTGNVNLVFTLETSDSQPEAVVVK